MAAAGRRVTPATLVDSRSAAESDSRVGTGFAYLTYLDALDGDDARDVALDPAANAYVLVQTSVTPPFPVTADLAPDGGTAGAFVLKLDGAGQPQQATRVGTANVTLNAIAVDSAGQAHVAGIVPPDGSRSSRTPRPRCIRRGRAARAAAVVAAATQRPRRWR